MVGLWTRDLVERSYIYIHIHTSYHEGGEMEDRPLDSMRRLVALYGLLPRIFYNTRFRTGVQMDCMGRNEFTLQYNI